MDENSAIPLPENNQPAVTIVIPCYNCESTLARSIESVLSQTWRNYELLLVDDGSTDNSLQVFAQYASRDPRLRLVQHERNRGLPAARNTGIRIARGELIAFLDADDWWLPEKLSTQVPIFNNPAIGASCLTSILVCPDREEIQRSPQAFVDRETLYRTLLYRNAIPGSASSMIVRKNCFNEIGLFNEDMVAAEDHDMWIRLAQRYSIHWIDSALVYIDKTRPGSMTKTITRMAKGRDQFLLNRVKDILPQHRYLLPDARRLMHIQTAIELLRVDNLPLARLYSSKAISASVHINQELRRAIVLFFLACTPLSFQRRFLRPARRRILKIDD